MPCVMAHKHEWCVDHKKLIKASDGNLYCIFHAPLGEKEGVGVEEFNKLVVDHIKESVEQGTDVDLRGTIFEGDFSFADIQHGVQVCCMDFSGATFSGRTDFASMEFGSKVSFKGAIFSGPSDFSSAVFNSTAHFDNATFNEEAIFTNALFKEQAHFFDANFLKKADFSDAVFSKEVYFTLGAFKAGALFKNVKYGARAVFKRPYPGIGAKS